MLSIKSLRWAAAVASLIVVLATPMPALAAALHATSPQDGSNCFGYQDGSNCYGYQDGGNSYGYQGGYGGYGYQGGYGGFGCSFGTNCYGNQVGAAFYGGSTGATYVVQPGDTMRIIADRFGIPLQALISANPGIWNPNLIYPGQVICLPTGPVQPMYFQQPSYFGQPAFYQSPQAYVPPHFNDCCFPDGHAHHNFNRITYYTVVKGDTLDSIAKKFGTTVQAIMDLNGDIKKNQRIHVGQVLRIW